MAHIYLFADDGGQWNVTDQFKFSGMKIIGNHNFIWV